MTKIAACAVALAIAFVPAAAFAAAPKTKEACEKAKNMKWDETANKCVKAPAAKKAPAEKK
jgi:hypothetical protein